MQGQVSVLEYLFATSQHVTGILWRCVKGLNGASRLPEPLGRNPLQVAHPRGDGVPDLATPAVEVASPRAEVAVVPVVVMSDDHEIRRVDEAHG
jgi:hypothetical protein